MRSKIAVYYTRNGRQKFVIEEKPPIKYPFRQMQVGDWFEVHADEGLIDGNLTGLASSWGTRLDRVFQTRTIGRGGDRKMRVTRVR